ncbi:MAG: hypothetical protein WD669_03325 [Pirellulales bacterium]
MTKSFSLAIAAGAALALGLLSADESQAWFGRNGGSNGGCGSHGGSFGGSNGGGGSFGGLFSRGSRNGGSCGENYGSCGSHGGHYGAGHTEQYGTKESDSTTPPPAPRDPGGAAATRPGGETSAARDSNAATKVERTVMLTTPVRRPRWIGF